MNDDTTGGHFKSDDSVSKSNLARAVRRYWDAHPVATDSAPYERGTRAQFDAIYSRWQSHGTSRRREFLESCRKGMVLEVGCGLSMDGRFLSENGVDYQAVDLSFESLKLANEHFLQNDLRRRFANAVKMYLFMTPIVATWWILGRITERRAR